MIDRCLKKRLINDRKLIFQVMIKQMMHMQNDGKMHEKCFVYG